MLIGFGVFLVVVFGLGWMGNRRRRGVKPWERRRGPGPDRPGELANRENALGRTSHTGFH
jgi:hypothetical protein